MGRSVPVVQNSRILQPSKCFATMRDMPRGRQKNPENHTSQEAIAYFLRWADQYGYDDPAITTLRTKPTRDHVPDVILWAESSNFSMSRRTCANACRDKTFAWRSSVQNFAHQKSH
jgi:hypothetical protein